MCITIIIMIMIIMLLRKAAASICPAADAIINDVSPPSE